MQNNYSLHCLQANSWQDTTNPPSVTSPPGPPGSVHSDTSNWFGGSPAVTSFPLRSALTTILCPHFPLSLVSQLDSHTRLYSHFINTHCAGTQDSWTAVRRNTPSTPQLHFNARISLTQNKRRMELFDAETNKTSLLSRTFWKPLTQLCRWSWCLYIMCICTLTSHSTHTACPRAVDLCFWPFALENCVWLPVSLEALAFDSQTVDTDHQRALLTLLVPKSCHSSCQHICSSELTLCRLDTRHFQSFITSIFHSIGDFKVSTWDMHKCACTPPSITHTSQLFSHFYRELT